MEFEENAYSFPHTSNSKVPQTEVKKSSSIDDEFAYSDGKMLECSFNRTTQMFNNVRPPMTEDPSLQYLVQPK